MALQIIDGLGDDLNDNKFYENDNEESDPEEHPLWNQLGCICYSRWQCWSWVWAAGVADYSETEKEKANCIYNTI